MTENEGMRKPDETAIEIDDVASEGFTVYEVWNEGAAKFTHAYWVERPEAIGEEKITAGLTLRLGMLGDTLLVEEDHEDWPIPVEIGDADTAKRWRAALDEMNKEDD